MAKVKQEVRVNAVAEAEPRNLVTDEVRVLIIERASELKLSLSRLSTACGKNSAYMHQFLSRGSPHELPESVRVKLATLLDVPEDKLRHSPAPSPVPLLLPPSRKADPSLDDEIRNDVSRLMESLGGVPKAGRPPAQLQAQLRDTDPMPAGVRDLRVTLTYARGRLRPGDVAVLSEEVPARCGDTVAIVSRNGLHIEAIGSLLRSTRDELEVAEEAEETKPQGQKFARGDVQVLKVVRADFA